MIFLMELSMMACAHTPAAAPALGTDAPAPSTMVEQVPPSHLHAQMEGLVEDTFSARYALIADDLETARATLARVAAMPMPSGLAADYQPRWSALVGAAQTGSASADASGLALAVAQIGADCGACHADTGAHPVFADVAPAEPSAGVVGHMGRHVWAVEKMWQALVTNSDESWVEATAALAEDPLSSAELPAGASEAAKAWDAHIHEVGTEAFHSATVEQRVTLTADLLVSCGGCHRMMPKH